LSSEGFFILHYQLNMLYILFNRCCAGEEKMKNYLNRKLDLDDLNAVSVIDELPLWSAPFGLKLLETIKLKPKIRVLDLGCGLGFPLLEIAQRLGNSSTVYGIDPWERAIERIKLKIKMYNLSNVVVINGEGEKLPFESRFFDLIVSNNGINNVENIDLTLSECYRVANSGAQLTTTLNLNDTMTEFYQIFQEILVIKRLFGEVEKMKQQIYSKRKPLCETEDSLKKAGFEIKKIVKDSFNLRFVDGTAMFNHFLMNFFIDGWKGILKPIDLEDFFEKTEERLNEVAKKKGELKLSVPFVTIDCRKN